MAFNIGELVGFVKLDTSGVRTGMQSAEREVKAGMARTSQAAEQGGKDVGGKFSKGVTGSTLTGLKVRGGAVVAGFALDKVVGFLGDATQAASDLQQTAMKSNVIFGAQAQAIDDWASKSVDSFGLSKTAALEAAAGFGDMFMQLGDTQEQAAKTSKSVVEMAADLGSFNNLDTGDVLDRISAAMRGEYDSLQKLIPNISAARVQQEAMTETGKKNAAALTAQEKAHATLAIIQKDGARAQGDFARSAGTFAIEQQKATARSEELSAKIGQQLMPLMTAFQELLSNQILPALSSLVDMFVSVAKFVGDIPGPVKAAVIALTAFHLLKGPLGSMLDTVRIKAMYAGDSLKNIGKSGAGVKAGLSGLVGAINPWTVALGAATFALTHYFDEAQKVNGIADSLAATVDKATGAFTASSRTSAKEALFGDLSADDIKLLEDLGVNFDELAKGALEGGAAYEQQRDKVIALVQEHQGIFSVFSDESMATEGLLRSYVRLGDGADRTRTTSARLKDETQATGDAAQEAAPKVDTLAIKEKLAHDAAATAAESHKELAQAILDVADAAVSADQAESDWQQAIDDADKAIKENGRTVKNHRTELDLNTEAGRNNQDALIGLRDKALEVAEANLTQGDSTDSVKGKMALAREEFIKVATKMGLNKTAAEKLATQYGLTEGKVDDLNTAMGETPAEVKAKIEVNTAAAKIAMAGINAILTAFDNRVATATATVATAQNSPFWRPVRQRFGGPVGHIPGYAGGTLIGPGTGTSDSIHAFVRQSGRALMLSNGEFISTESSRRRNQAALEAGNKGAQLTVAGTETSGGLVQHNTFNMPPNTTPKEVAATLGWEMRR